MGSLWHRTRTRVNVGTDQTGGGSRTPSLHMYMQNERALKVQNSVFCPRQILDPMARSFNVECCDRDKSSSAQPPTTPAPDPCFLRAAQLPLPPPLLPSSSPPGPIFPFSIFPLLLSTDLCGTPARFAVCGLRLAACGLHTAQSQPDGQTLLPSPVDVEVPLCPCPRMDHIARGDKSKTRAGGLLLVGVSTASYSRLCPSS